jgi:signal peptidase II
MNLKKIFIPLALFLSIVACDQISKVLVRDYFLPVLPESINTADMEGRYIPRLPDEMKSLLKASYFISRDGGSFSISEEINPDDYALLKESMVRSGLLPRKREAIPIIGRIFWLNYHENTGVAFGLFSGLPRSVSVPLFSIITLLAVWIILRFYQEFDEKQKLPRLALIGILGGAVGNLIDRIALGAVTDFFDLATHEPYRNLFPIFNVADSFIVIGVGILIIYMLAEKRHETKALEQNSTDS